MAITVLIGVLIAIFGWRLLKAGIYIIAKGLSEIIGK